MSRTLKVDSEEVCGKGRWFDGVEFPVFYITRDMPPTPADIAAWLRAHPREAWDIVQGNDMRVLGPWIEVQNEDATWYERNPLGEYDTVLAIAHSPDERETVDAKLRAEGWILA
jgi:hypothetical protein